MTAPALSDQEFLDLRTFIEAKSGITVGDSKRYLIETRLVRLVTEVGCSSFSELHQRLVVNPKSALAEKVVDAMTTNETLWFRDQGPWKILNSALLPKFTEALKSGQKRRIRIWSAACSTGQEPYSIAMSILEHIASEAPSIKEDAFEIVGSDLSPSALFVATSGRYDRLSIERGLSPEFRERYFEESEDSWAVQPRVKSMVRLERRNLCDPFDALGSFDLVLCRNVLIYFSATMKRDIVSRLAERLAPGGAFIIGASESLQGMMGRFKMKQSAGNFYYESAEGGKK
ncbi:MAG: protein-glutamate O-methyltransferase CheR [bacterium]|nr:protein-glutamate O-methyltransferase CheR [bacterium]